MTVRNLEYLFAPRSIAVIGASDRTGSVGGAVTRNVLAGGFKGPIALVNPAHDVIDGRMVCRSVAELDIAPDLAVICTPPATIPELIAQLGARGTRAAVVLTAGLNAPAADGSSGGTVAQAMLAAARPHMLRVLGPNCVGMLSPGIGLNASFAHAPARKGHLAFVSQSGALTTALLDWARERDIGFSHFVSLGEAADVDFGDVLNYLAADPNTTAILLYIESINAARKFMSAARAAGRTKSIIVVKAGRAPEGAKAAASHTGALAGSDDIYDAAIRRAGAIRVSSTTELFIAAETLARARPIAGECLAIVTNGGGLAVLAADALSLGGGKLATLSAATLAALDAKLPRTWSHANPVDIIGDAPAARYVEALASVLADPAVDAVLLLHAPTAIVDSTAIAAACMPLLSATRKPVFTCWLGGEAVRGAKLASLAAGLPTYETPEEAVTGFLQVVLHRRNRQSLLETPPSYADDLPRDAIAVRRIVDTAQGDARAILDEVESKNVLRAYGIGVVETRNACDVDEAVRIAGEIGYPVALKILSPDITHKSDVGGVALQLLSAESVAAEGERMLERVRSLRPDARIAGFTVEQMLLAANGIELIAGIASDPVFGPVILFGAGGTAVETLRDKAVALPPLNAALARDLIGRTRVAKLLAGYRNVPGADLAAIERALLGLAQLAADFPEIAELDINPLVADEHRAIALDARIRIARTPERGTDRFAIRPYPRELELLETIHGRLLLIRPIRPDDEHRYPRLLEATSREDLYFRFFRAIRSLGHADVARFTQIDYDREMALVAVDGDEIVGVVRAISDPDNARAEFAILVRSDWTGRGLGYSLMSRIIAYCRGRGIAELFGEVLSENARMLQMVAALGFSVSPQDREVITVSLRLDNDIAPSKEGITVADQPEKERSK